MIKYIDADLLRKEIDNVEEGARKVRVSGTDKEAIGADGKVKLCLELKAIINSLQQEEPEKPILNDLEEAAEKYASTLCDRADEGLRVDTTLESAFKAGAEWKEEQMKETYCSRWEKWKEVEETARHEYENGLKDGKEEMMSEAVEGVARPDDCEIWVNLVGYGYKFNDGDKVRIIILKEN